MKHQKGQIVRHRLNGQVGKIVKIDKDAPNAPHGLNYQVDLHYMGKVWAKEEWLEDATNDK